MRQTSAVAAILAVLALPAGSADEKPAKPKATPEQTERVTMCYSGCIQDYARSAHDVALEVSRNNSQTTHCRLMRNALVSANSCESSCNSLWTLYNRPAVKLRADLQAWLVQDSTDFGKLDCHKSGDASLALHNGIKLVVD